MSLYKQPDSENWYANISVPGRPRLRQSTGTTDRAAAQRIHDELKAQVWKESPAKIDEQTWGDAVEAWLDIEDRSDSELLSLRKLGTFYSDRPLSLCTAESLETALSFCKTAGTYTRYRTMVTAILNVAKSKGWITETPKLAMRKDKKKKTRKWLTLEQWKRLYAELPPHMQPMAEFAIQTGLRQANVLGLTWAQVDMKRKFVWIEAQDMKDDDALPVPLSAIALGVLRAQWASHDHKQFVFTYRGKPIKEIKTAFQAACIRAGLGRKTASGIPGIRKADHYEGFTWHGLRHTWATWHVQAETPLDVLQKLGGWADLRMVMNYGHHSPGHLAAFADNAGTGRSKTTRPRHNKG